MRTKIHPYYYLAGFIGLLLGYIISKVYQIWVIVYLERDSRVDILPLFWETIYKKPALFTFNVVLIFILICITFVKMLLSRSRTK
ncbi:hypothetical protein CGZ75_09265 [Paenibacillus herberti]|uniref:Uncharacterized protein n=1 Tax=Paenibacillus herberti TaxID=1619309 RepID=A0A229P3K2_9BACL|nr:hypothetical protein CGZ75_09265 [Paenibacillus herberti]